jgi:hypothetical protein
MKINLSKYIYLLPFFSVIYCYYYSVYVYDGYHFGLIFSNALDLNSGKLPYKEIFIEYGYITTLIHSIILKIFGNEVFYLQIYTSLIYSTTLILITFLVKKFTNEYLALLSLITLILIYPIPLKPWPIYNSYFFYTLSLVFFLKKENLTKLISGICLSLAYLSFTTVYNFILIPLISMITFFYLFFYYKNKLEIIKLVYFLLGTSLPILIFIFYLINLEILNYWILYQKIPIVFALEIADKNILQQIIFYIKEISINAIINYVVKPHQILFGLIFFITIFIFIKELFHKIKNKKNKGNEKYIIISIFVLALTPHAQIGGLEKYTTSHTLGIIVILIFLNNIKSIDLKYFISTFLVFTVILISINNYSHPEYSSLKINTFNKQYNSKDIKYFKKQKWTEKKWIAINNIIEDQKTINKICNIKSSLNLTDDSYYYVILENKNQLIPFVFERHGDILRKIVEPKFYKVNQKKIFNENLFLITSKNNHKLFNINNYSILKKYSIDENNLNLNNISVMVPKSCFQKINSY